MDGIATARRAIRALHGDAFRGEVAVLGIGDAHLETHRLAGVEKATVRRVEDFHQRRGVAHGDDGARFAHRARGIGDLQRHSVLTGLGESETRRGFGRRFAAAEIPRELERIAIGVARGTGIEAHLQRLFSRERRRGERGYGRTISAPVAQAQQLPVGVAVPFVAILEDEHRVVRRELDVHRLAEDKRRRERLDAGEFSLRREPHDFDPVARPFVNEQRAVEMLRQLEAGLHRRIEMIKRPGHRRTRPAAEFGKFLR